MTIKGVYLEITSKCNGFCPYCHNNSKLNGADIPLKNIKNIIDSIDFMPPEAVLTLSGGEPTLHPDFVKIVRYSLDKGNGKIRVITNGSLIDRLDIYELLSYCEVQLTIETLNSKLHDKYRGEGTFALFSKIKSRTSLYSGNGKISLRVNISERNANELSNIIEQASKWGVDIIRFAFLQNKGRAIDDECLIDHYSTPDKAQLIINQLENLKKNQNPTYPVFDLEECYPRDGCELMFKDLIPISPCIDAFGNVYPCNKFMFPDYVIGNVKKQNIKDILYGGIFNAFLLRLQKRYAYMEECQGCVWKNVCFKGCPAVSHMRYSSLDRISGDCDYLKSVFKTMAKK